MQNSTLLNVGAAYNDWTAASLTTSGTITLLQANACVSGTVLINHTATSGGASATFQAQVTTCASSTDAQSRYNVASGQSWRVGLDNGNSDRFAIAEGGLGACDALRITTGRVTTLDCQGSDFDWWCPSCGYATGIYRSQCPRCQAGLEWHCDNLPMKQLSNLDTRVKAEQHLSRLGVLELSCNTDGSPWRGMNVVNGIRYSWGMARQNHDQINRDYECLNERLTKLEAQV